MPSDFLLCSASFQIAIHGFFHHIGPLRTGLSEILQALIRNHSRCLRQLYGNVIRQMLLLQPAHSPEALSGLGKVIGLVQRRADLISPGILSGIGRAGRFLLGPAAQSTAVG